MVHLRESKGGHFLAEEGRDDELLSFPGVVQVQPCKNRKMHSCVLKLPLIALDGGIMEREYENRELRKILIGSFLWIAFDVIRDTVHAYNNSGHLTLTLSDPYGMLSSLIFLDVAMFIFMYLPMNKALAELKSKGYKVSENSVNSYQHRKIELDLDLNTACTLCVNYLKTLTNCRIIKQDCDNGFIAASHKLNARKITRDRIDFDIKKQSDKTIVKIRRIPKMDLGGLYGCRNYIMMEETLDYLKRKIGSEKFRVLETEETFE